MNAKADLFIDARCELGEGPLWHSLAKRLFWFDITNRTLFGATESGEIVHRIEFDDAVSAAGVIDADSLLVAQAGALLRLSLTEGTRVEVAPLERDKPTNRPNDGRVDPAGGLWIGTMNRADNAPTGALYQYRHGTLTTILPKVGIPNATCFSPDGRTAYFADTLTTRIRKVAIDPDTGLPVGAWSEFADTEGHGWPDGAVVDSEGYLWSARWGGSCVVRHAPDGSVDRIVELPVSNVTCPAFGGADLRTLYITSARQGLSAAELEAQPHAGSVFSIRVDVPGQTEHIVRP